MKEQGKKQEEALVIDVNLTRGLVALLTLALLTIAVLGYLTIGQDVVEASAPQAPAAGSTGLRQYYMTKYIYNGGSALTACASGYHMASLWEIVDTSNLEYNTTLGVTRVDSGQGAPTNLHAWVCTGYDNHITNTPGRSNCNAWTNSASFNYGSYVNLPSDWTVGQDIHVWNAGTHTCNTSLNVWCVED